MRRSGRSASTLVLLTCLASSAALACRGSGGGGDQREPPSCALACQRLSTCAETMGVTMSDLTGSSPGELTPESCAARCEDAFGGRTEVQACLADLPCTSATALSDARAAITACGSATGDLPACPASDAILTVSPLADEDIAALTPLGNLNPPGHVLPTEHQYFYLGSAGAGVPVSSPGHLFATAISSSEHLSESPRFTDWDVTLAACDGLTFRFGHVASLSAPLAAAVTAAAGDCSEYTAGGKGFRACRYAVHVELQPGDAVGTAGGNPGQLALDLGANDTRKPAVGFLNPGAYGSAAYARCFLDYATDALRASLATHVQRTVAPICGSHAQDLAGTIQGNWRRAGFPTIPEDPHLALVHDMTDPSRIAISVGTSLSPATAHVSSPPRATSGQVNRDPSQVEPGPSPWCWDLDGGIRLIVSFPTVDGLQAEAQSGLCGAGPFQLLGAPVEFVR